MDMAPIPVSIVKETEELTGLAPEFGAPSTYSIPQIGTTTTGSPVQIMQRRVTRTKAIISIDVLGGGATGVMLAHRPDYLANAGNPQGFLITAVPKIILWENQQPCYAAAIGGGPVSVSVLDQAQAAAQASAEESVQSAGYDDETLQEEGGRGRQYSGNEY